MTKKRVSEELMELLICPVCRESVTQLENSEGIQCKGCKLIYPIIDGIPVMLADEAMKG